MFFLIQLQNWITWQHQNTRWKINAIVTIGCVWWTRMGKTWTRHSYGTECVCRSTRDYVPGWRRMRKLLATRQQSFLKHRRYTLWLAWKRTPVSNVQPGTRLLDANELKLVTSRQWSFFAAYKKSFLLPWNTLETMHFKEYKFRQTSSVPKNVRNVRNTSFAKNLLKGAEVFKN